MMGGDKGEEKRRGKKKKGRQSKQRRGEEGTEKRMGDWRNRAEKC